MTAISLFWVHTVTVETYAGQNNDGPVYDDPVVVPCFLDDTTKLVVGAETETVSQSTVFADVSYAGLFAADSRVTAGGRVTRVITVNAYTSGTLGLPDHVEVSLV